MENKKKVHGAEEKIKVCEETKSPNKNQIDGQNRTLKNVFIVFGAIVLAIVLVVLFINSTRHFEYEGVEFDVVKYCDAKPCLILYKTSIPVKYKDKITGKMTDADYNINLRNNPKDLGGVPMEGDINFRKNMVLDITTEDLFCDGDWNLAIGNLQKLNILGINFLVKNDSESYLPPNEFMFVTIQKNNITNIVEINENSYNLNVNDCEILEATEKLMLEAFIRFNELN